MLWTKRKTLYTVLITVFILFLCILKLKGRANYYLKWPAGNSIVIYNRIPKTGSTTFTNAIAYDLYKENGFNVLHVNMTKNRQVMSLPDQYTFINNVTTWTDRLPAFYHGHVAFIDFQRFGVANPIYINIIREPLERLLSHYYFLRYGDNYRVGLKRSRAGNNETFDECYTRSGKDCDMKQMWIQIPYFCGHYHFCGEVGNPEALRMAKQNAMEKYLLVGTTSRMRDMIALLEVTVPNFFKGALQHFDSLDANRAHLRYTKKKIPPNDQTLSMIRRDEVYKMEREFYDFIRDLFDAIFKKATGGSSKAEDLVKMPLQYHFEKIKPL
ncbi:CBN-HST-2 protein [Caenorhabditis brenneri]|uniref:CBN-HST-2 protein n=1 Tax=Caenorhabditis brenneri TaxID=135651 RepID=G0MI14_CAEBE|nr:CBN-HST-2 protein [Caenorhabditis brenneri]